MSKNIDDLRMDLVRTGQKRLYKKTIGDFLDDHPEIDIYSLSTPMQFQISADRRAQYKAYDAISMWLGNIRNLPEKDVKILIDLASACITDMYFDPKDDLNSKLAEMGFLDE